MKTYKYYIDLILVAACLTYFSDDVSAQVTSQQKISQAQSMGVASGNTSTSRSVSYVKDGSRVSISENQRGITISVDGKSVHAKNIPELKKNYPSQFRLYEEHLSNPRISTFASAGGSARGVGGGGNFSEESMQSRTISTVDNGKRISIRETKTGITVSVNGKRIKAKNAKDLKKKSPEAFRMYEKYLGGNPLMKMNLQPGKSKAQIMMEQQLQRLLDQNAGNPQMREIIERMLENLPQ